MNVLLEFRGNSDFSQKKAIKKGNKIKRPTRIPFAPVNCCHQDREGVLYEQSVYQTVVVITLLRSHRRLPI